ncbi:uncharacterized mitochondrial protein AtMg00860-like [Manihot esculenta]|uniref:uncharacterized mitochondrial protein AtMg00860-like n=1 Tax=Manihot esculenta TaxID=3983 RepID=UPI000B5D8131|nr:uncharacterized mitochondrial protein AtMg00860-like [Manihot esculenta]
MYRVVLDNGNPVSRLALMREGGSKEQHLQHLQLVLQLMKEHQLFAKMSKCSFGTTQIEYLGHVITAEGVTTSSHKIQFVQCWPIPQNIKQLRSFLGLTSYYQRFIQGYGRLAKPLTELLKKGAFEWNETAQEAFITLKQAMINGPVLALPNFSKPFIVETDASGEGIKAF